MKIYIQFAAISLLLLILIAVLTALSIGFILWIVGAEVPGLSRLLKLLSGETPEGPSLPDVLGGARHPLILLLNGWILLWLVLAVTFWFYPRQLRPLSVQEEPAQALQPTPTPARQATATPAPTAPASPSGPAPAPADTVADVLSNNGCGGCHTISGVDGMVGNIGPELTNIGTVAGARIQSEDYAGTATTPEEYIRESILNPQAYIVPDYQPVMPQTFGDTISQDQLDMLVDYLANLQ